MKILKNITKMNHIFKECDNLINIPDISKWNNSYLNGEIESRWYNLFFKFKDWYKN